MATVKICDGRTALYQWDVGVRLEMCGCSHVTECHFVTPDGVIKRDVVDNICDVPDAALKQAGKLIVYAFARTEEEGTTRHEFRLAVYSRPKPADYVDPPDEVDNLQALAERVAQLIQGGGGEPVTPEQIQQAVDNYLDKNPVQIEETDPTVPNWAKQPEKPNYTAEEVGAQPKGDYALKSDIPAVPVKSVNGKAGEVKLSASDVGALPANAEIVDATARAGVAENKQKVEDLTQEFNDFKENGGAGVTVDETLTVSGAAADAKATGEKINQLTEEMVKSVNGVKPDENGNVQVQGGGSEGEYELIDVITLEEDTPLVTLSQGSDGTPYKFKALKVMIETINAGSGTTSIYFQNKAHGTNVARFTMGTAGANSYAYVYAYEIDGAWNSFGKTFTTDILGNADRFTSYSVVALDKDNAPYIDMVRIYTLPVNGKIIIKGVRA